MVSQIRDLQVVTTKSESEALLMEAQQIKRYKPPFNILLRDDKSFPYILIRTDHEWPQLTKHRGAQKAKGHYFGPFASAGAVNKTLNTLQRAFLLRSCSDGFFESRTRPCLLYQIKRCAAPCVDRISHEDYDQLVGNTREFLEGKSQTIQRVLSEQMQDAAENMEYEQAAAIRDRIRALTRVQSHQGVNTRTAPDADVIAAHQDAGQTCVQVFFYRGGQNWGTRSYFPRHDKSETVEDVLSSFVAQFYDNKPAPKLILLSHTISGRALLEEALNLNAPHKVQILRPQRGDRRDMVDLAQKNARDSLAIHLAESSTQQKLMEALSEAFDLDSPPQRIEAYDNSHISGQDALGALVVMGPDGFQKNAYRKFNIKEKDIPAGDDYAMMREVFRRRFSRLIKEDPDRERGNWPDLVLIDGGAGQLSAVMEVMNELGLEDVPLVAIAKGPERNAGRERFF
ncbi:MAG: excinuclease ABC subunit UvrC, partial [Alphaproteobacteria bacterium]|nr:excinuclease ABC subunit UvrC [Alphaproteobacteria bacterium]